MIKNKSTIKIIGGLLKHHKLHMVDSEATRSSKAILKESLFNTLAPLISHVNFIEVFAGTGSIGIEALSRGAQKAIFIEKNPKSFNILNQNLNEIKQKIPTLNFQSFLGDSFELLPDILKQQDENSKNILFFDPPFPIRENFADIYSRCFKVIEKIQNKNNLLVIFECYTSHEMPQNIKDFSIIKAKKFGKSSLVYYANKEF
ncbi:16S rRNA (guanine(966)-N(2))-methyltransferase RsmD [Helicobacter anseris]|uniref:16S rRNA (Guanine(966)-N(2))-methyltransferase RsmD n=1 Tax=Helicobacter anseris TaxID=375926 RepID=A0A3D8J9V7_9HELI|nr:16S rRNA (guanine(966)-N(2))-methyltransferase RsmD [Helicobacter anseris]RDU73886.1 16S rRNA (guanine(966)-N(2))-methyltransferase RsmD [Helicobacter anseris]